MSLTKSQVKLADGKPTDDLAVPVGKDVEAVRPIRDEIEARIRRLLAELRVPVGD